jgi:uncharacterized protein with HEPN domain
MTLAAAERDAALLLDILSAAGDAETFLVGLDLAAFRASKLHQAAVIRCLEVVGEAASRLSPACRNGITGVPWRLVIGMRNKLIHDYGGIAIDLVWQVAVEELPALAKAVRPLVPPDQPGGLVPRA